MRSPTLIALGLASIVVAQSYTVPNTNASFTDEIQPFQINVDLTFIEETIQRVNNTRVPLNTEAFPYSDGAVLQNWTAVRDEWVNSYDWEAVQTSINANLTQFTTIVHFNGSNYTQPVPLHFVHHTSPRADAIPLLFVHGWPGSFLEVSNIINLLTNPPNDTLPAFHVVAPSIPGFGFSPAPVTPGFGPVAAAHTFNALMLKLGYNRYVAQAGDWGGVTIRYQANLFPESVVSILPNFYVIPPSAADMARFEANQTTPEETSYITRLVLNFEDQLSGYRIIAQTAPLQLAYALTDSPLGLAMWIQSLIRHAIDYSLPTTPSRFDAETLITWTLMYWIQGPYAGLRFYKEAVTDGAWDGFGFGSLPYISQPIAITEYPYDVWYDLPLDWARREGNVQALYKHDVGGHFAAHEVPDVLAGDIWSWFGNREASGTSIFYE